ncbi:uncharacterized protein J3R85_021018 [Psidium guajava]|nr:uncharacterized protein J3R85_021018 [Psidium guajava]
MPTSKNDNLLKPYSQMQDAKRIPAIKKNDTTNNKNYIPGCSNYKPQWLFQPMGYRKVKRNELPNTNHSNSHQAKRQAISIYVHDSDEDTSRRPDNSACRFRATIHHRPQATIKQGF